MITNAVILRCLREQLSTLEQVKAVYSSKEALLQATEPDIELLRLLVRAYA